MLTSKHQAREAGAISGFGSCFSDKSIPDFSSALVSRIFSASRMPSKRKNCAAELVHTEEWQYSLQLWSATFSNAVDSQPNLGCAAGLMLHPISVIRNLLCLQRAFNFLSHFKKYWGAKGLEEFLVFTWGKVMSKIQSLSLIRNRAVWG